MINKFIEIVPKKLFRGSAPTPQDVLNLKKNFNIKKIVSLDADSAKKINRSCKMLDINHVVLPINLDTYRSDIIKLLQHDLKKLLLDDGPTFVHCLAGKDRTGFIIALFKCKYMGMDPEDAIVEAKELGFGVGVDDKIINLFEMLIRSCKPAKSIKTEPEDIVSNQRQYIGDSRDSFLDEGSQGSFAPYISQTRQYPVDEVYNHINDQSPTRENYNSNKTISTVSTKRNIIPMVGIFNNDAGIHGAGPTEPVGGFVYE